MIRWHWSLLVACLPLLAACGGGTGTSRDSSPVPKTVKIGKPYEVMGQTYVPAVQLDYDEIGVASWYGPGFHGKPTANGERFNSKAMTAAHATLPLPSMVRVTDLLTGRNVIVRVNDRGPFSEKRIIDLSEAAASELGIKARGLAKVRVQFLAEETDQYLAGISTPHNRVSYPRPSSTPAVIAIPAESVPADGSVYADLRESRHVAAVAPVGSVEQNDLPPAAKVTTPRAVPGFIAAPMPLYRNDDGEVVALEGDEQVRPLPESAALQSALVATPIEDVPPPFRPSGMYIQAGSFTIPQNAEHLAQRLSSIGPAFVASQSVRNQTWYRVRLGPVEERHRAEAMLREVNGLGFADAKIVQD